jgi:hypothetical protein
MHVIPVAYDSLIKACRSRFEMFVFVVVLLFSDSNCDFNGAGCITFNWRGLIHGRTDGHGGVSGHTYVTSHSE